MAFNRTGILLVSGLMLMAGCSRSSSENEGGLPKASFGKGIVQVDNGSDRAWELQVDGKPSGEIPARAVVPMELSKGRHTFVVLLKGEIIEKIEAEVGGDEVTVLNPGGRSTYNFITASYESFTGKNPGSAAPSVTSEKSNQAVCRAQYGLLQKLPQVVEMDGLPTPKIIRMNQETKMMTRTKLARIAPNKPSLVEARFMLAHPEAYQQLGEEADAVRIAALAALGQGVDDPEIRKILISFLDSSSAGLVNTACLALGKHADAVEPARLWEWVSRSNIEKEVTPREDGLEKSAVGSRVLAGTRLLLARNLGLEIVQRWPSLPEANRLLVLRAHEQASPEQKRAILFAAFDAGTPRLEDAMSILFTSNAVLPDPEMADRVEKFAAAHKVPYRQKVWKDWLGNKICNQATNLPPAWVISRLIQYVKTPDASQAFVAMFPLADLDAEDQLLPIYPTLKPELQRMAIKAIARRNREAKTLPPAALEIAWLGLVNADRETHRDALTILCAHGLRSLEDVAKAKGLVALWPRDPSWPDPAVLLDEAWTRRTSSTAP